MGATLRCVVRASHCSSFPCCGAQVLGTWDSVVGTRGSVAVVHGLSCSVACGIFPDQGLNLCLLHWQADSFTLYPQGNPHCGFNVHFSDD